MNERERETDRQTAQLYKKKKKKKKKKLERKTFMYPWNQGSSASS